MKRNTRLITLLAVMLVLALGLTACAPAPATTVPTTTETEAQLNSYTRSRVTDGTTEFYVIENPGDGPRLTFSVDSIFDVITVIDGNYEFAFRDMDGDGSLSPWEDWRLDPAERAADHVQNLTIAQISGLMLFSPHVRDLEDGMTPSQQELLGVQHLRNFLNAAPVNEFVVPWVNQMQAYAEALTSRVNPFLPVNFASDPRATAGAATYNAAGGNSRWPSNLGLAATHDIDLVKSYARAVSAELRAMGVTTLLGPMIDVATEPRWPRVEGTFGENVEWASELTAAVIEGYQGSYGLNAWGTESVNAIIKHFAGDGATEGGRGAHNFTGRYEVFHGGMESFQNRVSVFRAGLNAAGAMPGYAVALDGDGEPLFQRRGTIFDHERIGMLRDDWGFDGVSVSDWGVTRARRYGVENLTEAELHFEVLLAGNDQFGGNSAVAPIREAFDIWQSKYEAREVEIDADTRWRLTGRRVLQMMFQAGLFESTYLIPEEANAVIGSQDKVDLGFEAQLASIVLARNVNNTISESTLADWSEKTVYVPHTYLLDELNPRISATPLMPTAEERAALQLDYNRNAIVSDAPTLTLEMVDLFFGEVVTDVIERDADGKILSITAPDMSNVDIVLVGLRSAMPGSHMRNLGYDLLAQKWIPLALQYRPYTADGAYVRRTSISGHILADGTRENRSYYGNTSFIRNEADLDAFERAVAAVEASGRDIPVITILSAMNPIVPLEFYEDSDAIVIGFGVSHQALLHVALGLHEPTGRLPIAFPADMNAVERQLEDIADTDPFIDTDGNAWDFGFGLNWSGPIPEN